MDKSFSLVKRGKISSILDVLIRLIAIARFFGFQKIVKNWFLLIIRIYQQYISPHKGFACAYRILHQEQSCSSYFYTCITEQDLSSACILLQQRLVDCQQAHGILKMATNYRHQRNNQRRRKETNDGDNHNDCFNCRDLIDLSSRFISCDIDNCDLPDFPDCDLVDCDFVDCDLLGCDFIGCDF